MKIIFIFVLLFFLVFSYLCGHSAYSEPFLYDKNLKIEKVVDGLVFPVSVSFLGDGDMLILEKNNGTVNRIVNGQILGQPLLHFNVDNSQERGLLGSAIHTDESGKTNVFLYFTEIENNDSHNQTDSQDRTISSKVMKYDFKDGKLINPKLLFELPITKKSPFHVGGKLTIGSDNQLYVTIGDLYAAHAITQNFKNGTSVNGSGGILRINLDDNDDELNGVIDNSSLKGYFAYGIRNSFGMDVDPISGYLWDTENGPGYGDEINLVFPGFNSGWKKVQGLWQPVGEFAGSLFSNISDLNSFGLENNYIYPKLTWAGTIGITAIKFLDSTNLGEGYYGDMFVGDFNKGDIYHFKLNDNRTEILDNSNMISDVEVGGKNYSVIYQDPFSNCYNFFKCVINDSTSITDNSRENRSLLLSTTLGTNYSWSWVYGQEYGVTPGINYTLKTKVEQNANTIASHISIQGFDKNTQLWIELLQCPGGQTGFLKETEFTCTIKISNNISKIQPIINAGWSSGKEKEATSVFSGITIYNPETNRTDDLMPELDTSFPIFGRGFGHITDIQVGPDGDLYVLSVNPRLGVDFDHSKSDLGKDGVLYKISKK